MQKTLVSEVELESAYALEEKGVVKNLERQWKNNQLILVTTKFQGPLSLLDLKKKNLVSHVEHEDSYIMKNNRQKFCLKMWKETGKKNNQPC